MDDTSSRPILKIPLEILLRITHHLTTPDLGNLRLTSQHFYRSLDPTFIKEFFTTKQFMITDDSLQALIDISKSRLGCHLRRVNLGLDRFPDNATRVADQSREARYYQLCANQFTLLQTGHHRDMLAEAFRNLKNMEDVVIRDFNSSKRRREGPYAHWRSYGSTTVYEETGVRLTQGAIGVWHSDWMAQYGSQIFAAVLYALGKAEARPKGIESMSRAGNHLRGFAFNIPTYAEPLIHPVLNNLEKLHIDIDVSWGNTPVGIVGNNATPRRAELADPMIRRFLLQCTNLKHLRINERGSGQQGIGLLLDWIGHDSNAPSPSPSSPSTTPNQASGSSHVVAPVTTPVLSPTFSHLEELNLGSVSVEASAVLKIIRKFAKSLKRLELWKVTLCRRLPSDTSGGLPKISFWTKFLAKLKDIPDLELHHLKFGVCTQQWYLRPSRDTVQFDDRRAVVEYTGPDWKHFIEVMMPKIEVIWSQQDDESVSEEEEDDDGVWDQYALDL